MSSQSPFVSARTYRPLACFLTLIISFLIACLTANAQTSPTDGMTPSGLSPGAPGGSYGLSGFDNVNLYNGHLNAALPLLGIGGRGSAQTQMTLNLRTTDWVIEKEVIEGSEYYYPECSRRASRLCRR